ncbi:glycosyltransferase family 2 protein [uncultured Lamprocystis sp.]|jgi:GT2 family glycosyltransferase|uniref:glycosyltransferase family 2 protein n=1 Tax=uncultured Lamprocystis sp. TaxID=543132 RepID=UPI0025F7B221|nr:glycosyltransferase family 2 protein [uncultured Lamprocystis sp.]
MDVTQFAEVYGHAALRLVVWHHAGRLAKQLDLALSGQPLPKPYLGVPVSDSVAAFLALTGDPLADPVSLTISDAAGTLLFKTPRLHPRPLALLRTDLADPAAHDRLLDRILKHAPGKLAGWSDPLTAVMSGLRQGQLPSAQLFEGNGLPVQTSSPAGTLRGTIDFIDGRRVTGWAIDTADPSRILRLRFEVNGVPAGTAVADDPRPDLDGLGADTRHGFQVILRKDTLASPWRETHRLDLLDQDSGRTLIAGYPLSYRADDADRSDAALVRRLNRLEQTLHELREQMPARRRRTAYALADYDLWYDEVHRLAPPPETTATPELVLPRISVVVPLTADTTLPQFEHVLESLVGQAQDGHQYLIFNRSQPDQAYEVLARSARYGGVHWIDARSQPSPAVLRAVLRESPNTRLLLLAPGEALAPEALAWIVHGAVHTDAKILYADSDRIDAAGAHRDPELRPDFNPDLLLSTPYIGAFCLDRTLLAILVPDLADEPEGVWQYDLLLRAIERLAPHDWLHIARVLTHRIAADPGPPADESGLTRALTVLQDHLTRTRAPATAELDEALYAANPEIARAPRTLAARLRWQLPHLAPKVSIIIPTRDAPELLRTCIESIRNRTAYPDFEILLVDHDTTDPIARDYLRTVADQPKVQVLQYSGAFNWSAINNLAAARAHGEVLCFLNNDTEVLTPDWLTELVGHACRPDIGAVGAKLLFPDGTIQHGGVILGVHGAAEHAFTGLPTDRAGYMMRAALTQNLSAVTGACLVCRRQVFDQVGGFEMVNLGVAFNDVDFCLRLTAAGYRNLWTPHARLRHFASATRGPDQRGTQRSRLDREIAHLYNRHTPIHRDGGSADQAQRLLRDPYYNPAFEIHEHPYATLAAVEHI